MPYRRLPNTDNARLKALKTANAAGKEIPPFHLAFSQGTYLKVQSLLPGYETAISEHKNAYSLHLEKNKNFHQKLKKARLYISHFIQVINMSIHRGELPASTRVYFQMEDYEKKLPPLTSDDDIYEWGKILIDGEKNRRMNGMSPITNPTIAVVKVHYENFLEAYNHQKSLKKRTLFAQDKLNNLREEADRLIQQLWNEVEESFINLPEEKKREKASEYGVVYVYRKNEINNLNVLSTTRIDFG